jgi:hypothetical protein
VGQSEEVPKTACIVLEINLDFEDMARIKEFLIKTGGDKRISVLRAARLEVKVQIVQEGKK